jgi:hypothetical protein
MRIKSNILLITVSFFFYNSIIFGQDYQNIDKPVKSRKKIDADFRNRIPDRSIPRQGLALWLTAEDAVVKNGNVIRIKDRSGLHNDAVLEKDPKIVAGNPSVIKHETAGRLVLRFNGAFTGYEFNAITNARTAFIVVAKHPAAFKKFAE